MSLLPLSLLLHCALASASEPWPDAVVIPLSALRSTPEDEPGRPPTTLLVDALHVVLEPGPVSRLRLEYTVRSVEPGVVDLPVTSGQFALTDAQIRGPGGALVLTGDEAGALRLTGRADGRYQVVLEGTLATPTAEVHLPVAPAARTTAEISDPSLTLTGKGASRAAGPGQIVLTPTDSLDLAWAGAAPVTAKPGLVTAESVSTLRLESNGLEAQATLRFQVLHQAADRLSFGLPGILSDLEVVGPNVAGFERSAGTVTVQLVEPVEGAVAFDVRYRALPPKDGAADDAPVPAPEAARSSGWVVLVRGDESIIVPEAGPGLEPVAFSTLPDRAAPALPGTPLVAYERHKRSADLRWRVMTHTPLDEPPTLIDEATYTAAHVAHGRVLTRATYQVRNDRNQYLRVRLPAESQVLGVRVAGNVVQPVRSGDRDLLVPLEKSVETLQGLVSFPVELFLLSRSDPWLRRGARTLETPSVDAPVASAQWELVLPPGIEGRQVEGTPTVVEQWTPATAGLQYGRAYARGRKDAPPGGDGVDGDKLASQDTWNLAYSAYKGNRFDDAEELLEKSLELDPDNNSAKALMGNVSMLLNKEDTGGDAESRARRIREMAKAKTAGMEVAQDDLLRRAQQSARAGDWDRAAAEYQELVELTESLAVVEQAEAVDQKGALSSYRQEAMELEKKAEEEKPMVKKPASLDAAPQSAAPESTTRSAVVVEDTGYENIPVQPGHFTLWFEPPAEPEPQPQFATAPPSTVMRGAAINENTYILDGRDIGDVDGEPEEPLIAFGSAVSSGEAAAPAEEEDANEAFEDDSAEDDSFKDYDGHDEPVARAYVVQMVERRRPSVVREMGSVVGSGLSRLTDGSREKSTYETKNAKEDDVAPPPPPPPPQRTPGLLEVPDTVTASALRFEPPRGGQVVLLEQRLLQVGAPMTVELRYRSKRRR